MHEMESLIWNVILILELLVFLLTFGAMGQELLKQIGMKNISTLPKLFFIGLSISIYKSYHHFELLSAKNCISRK